jgi:predicted nucleotide-binding protein
LEAEMEEIEGKKIKKLLGLLLRLYILNYLTTSSFRHLTLEYDLDKLWYETKHKVASNYGAIIGYDSTFVRDHIEEIFQIFIFALYNQRKENFVEIINAILSDAKKVGDYGLPLSYDTEILNKIEKVLVEINFAKNDVEIIFSNINPKSRVVQIADPTMANPEIKVTQELTQKITNVSANPKDKDCFPFTDSVFIVHGHDNEIKESVARFIEKIGLKAVILHEQPNQGRHLLQKLKDCSNDVGYAIILLTPDDLGKSSNDTDYRPRSRQNVILELGYFIGILEDKRVCVVYRPSVEIPSDYKGIGYIEYDEKGAWRMAIFRELKSLGYQVDWAA